MKRILTFSLLLATSGLIMFGNRANAKALMHYAEELLSVKWKNTAVDLGKIPQNIPAKAEFVFTNTGQNPVVIAHVQTSCGCTQPEWTKEPIASGATGKVSAVYNAVNMGPFSKTATVTFSNSPQSALLSIHGEVVVQSANK
jgi:hypothetical protein